jgi:hypothetical protein
MVRHVAVGLLRLSPNEAAGHVYKMTVGGSDFMGATFMRDVADILDDLDPDFSHLLMESYIGRCFLTLEQT